MERFPEFKARLEGCEPITKARSANDTDAYFRVVSIAHGTCTSDDMTWSHGGMCGKKQMIPVGMGGPAVKCRVTVGGRS